MILPELISREFLGSYVRQGDERWSILVKWVHYAMLEGEVLGITKANVDKIKGETKDPETRGFLGLEKANSASSSASTTTGPTGSSRRSATTARTTTPISARSPCRAAGTSSTTKAGCNTRCPGADFCR